MYLGEPRHDRVSHISEVSRYAEAIGEGIR